jgi:hypothetical protein
MLGSVTATLAPFVTGLLPARWSFLDAPRVWPVNGELARKCPACLEWDGPKTGLNSSEEEILDEEPALPPG